MKVVSLWLRVRRDPRLRRDSESKIPEAAVKTLYRKGIEEFFQSNSPLHFYFFDFFPRHKRQIALSREGFALGEGLEGAYAIRPYNRESNVISNAT